MLKPKANKVHLSGFCKPKRLACLSWGSSGYNAKDWVCTILLSETREGNFFFLAQQPEAIIKKRTGCLEWSKKFFSKAGNTGECNLRPLSSHKNHCIHHYITIFSHLPTLNRSHK